MLSNLIFRPPTDHDLKAIMHRWIKSSFNNNLLIKRFMPFDTYLEIMTNKIEKVTGSGGKILVAADKDEPTLLRGFVVYHRIDDMLIVHWIYTFLEYRKLGIASELLNQIGSQGKEILCTDASKILLSIRGYKIIHIGQMWEKLI